jgi:hypothetical protein
MTANANARFGDQYDQLSEILNEIEDIDHFESSVVTSLVQTPETTSPFPADGTYRGRFMVGKEKEYAATEEAYSEMYKSPSNQHLYGIRNCRSYATLQRDAVSGDVKVFGDSCRDRWCPMCAGQKAAFARDSTKEYIQSLKAPRFLTLTLRHNENGLKEQITFLQHAFGRLRARAYWKKNVTGGIWFLQVKRGKNSGCWHPHLHILLDGNYLEQGRVSALWELVTFGSPVIDIRRLHDIDAAAQYVSRYTARPAALADMPLDDRIEVINALFRKRLCGTFGTGKSVTLTPPKIESDGDFDYIGHYDDIARKATTDPAAKEIMIAYNTYQPLTEKVFEDFTGHPIGFVSTMGPPKPKNPQLLLDFYNTT